MSLPKLSISNLAWNSSEDEEVARILRREEVEFIDLAMGRYFRSPADASISDWLEIKETWARRGVSIAGMQSLLFGIGSANLFASREDRHVLAGALKRIFERAQSIGVQRLVFGSPANRKRLTFADSERVIAQEFFQAAGQAAEQYGVKLLLEPNSKRYGCNFLNSAREAIEFVSEVGSAGLGVNLDTGAQIDAGESITFSETEISFLGHLHLSETDLSPLREGGSLDILELNILTLNHFEFATVEQLGSAESSNLDSVVQALGVAKRILTQ